MSSDSVYVLKVIQTEATFVKPFEMDDFMMRLRKAVKEANHFLDEDGTSTGNGGEWRSLHEDMRPYSLVVPGLLIFIEERNRDGYEARHYFRDGRSTTIEPVSTWPEFNTAVWSD